MVLFYEMANGTFIVEAGRGITKQAIKKFQKEEWARKRGGICRIVEFTEPRAIFFAENPELNKPLLNNIKNWYGKNKNN